MYPFSPKLHSYPCYHITLSRVPCAILLLLSCFSHVQLLTTPWTTAHQAPLSIGFSRPEYWSGLLFPPPGDLLDPGIKPASPVSPALQADSLPSEAPVQFSSIAQLCLTLCDPMNCSMPGLPVHHQFLDLAQTHVL